MMEISALYISYLENKDERANLISYYINYVKSNNNYTN